jgi:hypothetical protein
MASYKEGALGPFHGRLGNVIGGTWKGKPYLRTRPDRRKKASKREQLNRDKFKLLHLWLQPLVEILRAGFKGYSKMVEGYNAAKSYNLKNAFTLVDEKYEFDPAKVLLSYGTLRLPENISCELIGRELHFAWENHQPAYIDHPDDRTMLLAYQPGPQYCSEEYYNISGARRKEAKDMLLIKTPGTYHVYFALSNEERTRQSNSVYLGVVEVAP